MPGRGHWWVAGMATSCTRGCDSPGTGLFCTGCGKLLEPGSLRTVTMGHGGGLHSYRVEEFFETGDPDKALRSKNP